MQTIRLAVGALAAAMAGCAATAPRTPSTGSAQSARLFEGMGGFHRPITTSSPLAQRFFDQGLTWAYAFNHDEAIRSFEHAATLDPSCAMAWWGVALCNGPHINRPGMDPAQNTAAWDAIQRARSLVDDESQIERDLVEALTTRYAAVPPPDRRALDESYASAMRSLRDRYPADADIAVLHAESLMDLRPWDLWTIEGQPREGTPEIVAALEAAIALNSDHPGANHLLIHALEASADPARATAAADRLRTLVPVSGHLVHMPSHIDVRTGRWALAAAANESAINVDRSYRLFSPNQGFYRLYMAHNLHFLSYVSMMEGRRERALSAARDMIAAVPEPFIKQNSALIDPYMSIEIESLKRFGRWDDILRLREPRREFPITRALWRHARGVAFAAKDRIQEARREHARLRSQVDAIPEDAVAIINKAHDVLAIADRVLAGEIAYREGNLDRAISELRAAAAVEDRLVYMEPPEWMIPVRHPLGAILLEAGKPAEAEREYREDLRRWPENGWSLFGLEKALRAQGRISEADDTLARFKQAFARADFNLSSSCACVRHGARAAR